MQKRTIVYVDGFNLYYGSLRKTIYKWLDLKALFSKLLPAKGHFISKIKYYTAKISIREPGDISPLRQKIYLLALQKYIPELEIFYGHYLTNQITAKMCNPPAESSPYIKVFKTEEKGSDVNLALHMLNDAWLNAYDCAVLVSNDSDLAEALRLIKIFHKKEIGIVTPGKVKIRKPSRELVKYADFRREIREGVLAQSQLPNPIPRTQIFKPSVW